MTENFESDSESLDFHDELLLVRAGVLPDVFYKVVLAKELLSSGEAGGSMTKAAGMAGISRSAFYKYKDSVSRYSPGLDRVITVQAILSDTAGALAGFVSAFFESHANILTVNQSIPQNGTALVSVSAKAGGLGFSVNDLLIRLRDLPHCLKIEVAHND